jgi:RNA recognition motif-containing protein
LHCCICRSEFFKAAGPVSDVYIAQDDNGSRGFGFVRMDTEEGVAKALELNGQYLEGREVHCEVAREREDRSQSAGKNWNSPVYVMNFSVVLSIFLETTNADEWCLTLSFEHQILQDNIQVIEDTEACCGQ